MWFDVIKALQRIALSENDKIDRKWRSPSEQVMDRKPDGLWYSFSLGQGWMRRQMDNYGWLEAYKYILYLDVSPLNILQIKSAKQASDFLDKYAATIGKIDWPRIASEYDGIEILNLSSWAYHNNEIRQQFYGWDIDSGCIWNTRNLKVIKVKPIEERHYKAETEFQGRD